ncbi:MAG: LA2681 family HEPN domain-containing protein [Gallionella sp.]|nr:LA2681 family HEPN domain-containing protein [Gallionella sp.]
MQERLNKLALEIDDALVNKADLNQLNTFLQRIEAMVKEGKGSSFEDAALNYYAANIYSRLGYIDSANQEHIENEIYHLRLASTVFQVISLKEDKSDLRYRVETNLGNALNHIGRSVEALAHYDSVIKKYPNFSMAYATKGIALFHYGLQLFYDEQKQVFAKYSHISLETALYLGVEEHAEARCQGYLNHLNSFADWGEISFEADEKICGRSKRERNYRQWCLDNRLFLNPVNDVLKTVYEAYDDLHLNSITTPISGSTPEIYGIYNQLKQEYISSRYILFEAIEESDKYSVHFSDKRVHLVNMLDGRFYRLWVEKMKMAFLAAYAIFDKIAYLINVYWQLEIKTDKIDFRKVWFENAEIKKGINPKLSLDKNIALNGLFWLSKDVFYKDDKRPTEPDAKQLNHIRNHISHKYLKVQHSYSNPASWRENNGHELTYPIDETELQEQTVKLLKLVRSSLIYVSLAIHWQEKQNPLKESDGLVAEMPMYHIEDNQRW